MGLSGVPPQARQGHHRPARGTIGLARAPRTCQGHQRPSMDTTCLAGTPPASQGLGHLGPVSGTTCLSGTLQACQEHHSPVRAQGHHRPHVDTTGLAKASWACQGHHGPVVGTSGLSGAPQFFQMHRRPSTMAPCLAEVAIRRMSPRISRAFAVFSWFQTFKHGI